MARVLNNEGLEDEEIVMNAIVEFKIDPAAPLVEALVHGIEVFSTKETIDCLISAIELWQEKLSDESKEYRDLQMILCSLEAVSKAAEILAGTETNVTGALGLKKTIEQKKRRGILAGMVLNMAQIKVM